MRYKWQSNCSRMFRKLPEYIREHIQPNPLLAQYLTINMAALPINYTL